MNAHNAHVYAHAKFGLYTIIIKRCTTNILGNSLVI